MFFLHSERRSNHKRFKVPQRFIGWATGLSMLAISPLMVVVQANPSQALTPVLLSQINVEPLSPTSDNGLFNIAAGKRLLKEAEAAVNVENYTLATDKLKDARQLMNQLSNFYQGLSSTFSGVDPLVSKSLRDKALETAELRDQSTYQLGLVYRAQNQVDQAIPLLIEIVRSQNPSRPLGQQAYRQLLELGFVDVAYPRTQTTGQTP